MSEYVDLMREMAEELAEMPLEDVIDFQIHCKYVLEGRCRPFEEYLEDLLWEEEYQKNPSKGEW